MPNDWIEVYETEEWSVDIGSSIYCEVCGKEHIPGISVDFSWHTIEMCFDCIDKAKNKLKEHELDL